MPEEKLIRIERLKAALDARHVEKTARARYLADACGSSVSYWSGLLAGDRSFGEKVARGLETGLGLPRGYLDQAGLTLPAMEVAEMFDQLDERGQAVLTATAHALMPPGAARDGPDPPLPSPSSPPPASQRKLSA